MKEIECIGQSNRIIYNQPNLKLFGVMKIHKQIGVFIGEIERNCWFKANTRALGCIQHILKTTENQAWMAAMQ